MLKSVVRDTLFAAVASIVKPLGFQSSKKEFSFIHKFEGGFHGICFPIVDYRPEIIAGILVDTRLDDVDDLANKFNTTIAPEARASKTIIQVQPDYFGRAKKYIINDETELTRAVAEMLDVLENHILPFMEQCTKVAFVGSVLEAESGSMLKPNPLGRALVVIACASLCGRQDIAAVGAKARAVLEVRNIASELEIFDRTLEHILKGSTE